MLSNALSLFEGVPGVVGAYLFVGALVTSYMLVQLAPVSMAKARMAGAEYPDRVSKLLVGLWTLYPHIWAVGIVAAPATALWPISLAIFRRFQNKRNAMRLEAARGADVRELERLASAIRKDRANRSDVT